MAQKTVTSTSDETMLTRRALLRLGGLAAGGVALASGMGALDAAVPAEAEGAGRMYEYAYLREKYPATAFMVANRLSDTLLSFGSSDFNITASVVPEVPAAVFGGHDYGVDLWYIGEADNQSLWHAIAFGAYAKALDEGAPTGCYAHGTGMRKAVFFVSPQWWLEGGIQHNAMKTLFSYNLWRNFCQNPNVTATDVSYAAQRLLANGIDAPMTWAGTKNTVPDSLNDLVLSRVDSFNVRRGLVNKVRAKGGSAMPECKKSISASEPEPDWAALKDEALVHGAFSCTSNEFYIYDTYWNKRYLADFRAGKLKDSLKKRSFLKAPTEETDFDLALTVAPEVGLDLLCILLPCAGPWWDYQGFPYDDRQQRYELMRQACASHGARVLDLTPYEYEPYFTCDGTHLGWTGWLAVEQAVYNFAMGR